MDAGVPERVDCHRSIAEIDEEKKETRQVLFTQSGVAFASEMGCHHIADPSCPITKSLGGQTVPLVDEDGLGGYKREVNCGQREKSNRRAVLACRFRIFLVLFVGGYDLALFMGGIHLVLFMGGIDLVLFMGGIHLVLFMGGERHALCEKECQSY